MTGISAWGALACAGFDSNEASSIFKKKVKPYDFDLFNQADGLWLLITWGSGYRLACRLAFSPGAAFGDVALSDDKDTVSITASCEIGRFEVQVNFPSQGTPIVRYVSQFIPASHYLNLFWPRDLVFLGKEEEPNEEQANIHVKQEGCRTGLLFLTMPNPADGTIFYMQNLSALNDYCKQTKTSLAGTVGGRWPELGFALPTTSDNPLQAGSVYCVSDAFLLLGSSAPKGNIAVGKAFLENLGQVYLHLPRPETKYYDWPLIVSHTLHDLSYHAGCWTHADGRSYINAYLSDYKTPPEIMVQLAVLLPMLDYFEWLQDEPKIVSQVRDGLPYFFDKKLGTIMRWLPSKEANLDGSEEHKVPKVMDAWYLHHPLVNLARLAKKKDKKAQELFIESLEFAIRVAKHFNYQWPVFYRMDTLEVVKAETEPGKGGEKDVAGIYAHVCLEAYDLTGEKRYLEEARKAALTLEQYGFDIFYQANNTAFAAKSLVRLYKITGKPVFLDVSYMCLASMFQHMFLWQCEYGYGTNYNTFFGVFPLKGAPYLAAYEEQECFSAFHDYLSFSQDIDILPSIRILLAEFVRYASSRLAGYYPPLLPKEMLNDQPQSGEVDLKVWMPIEDLQDGWKKSAQVGQEVYGAGMAFGLLPRQYVAIPEAGLFVFVEYPVLNITKKNSTLRFDAAGDARLQWKMRVMPFYTARLPKFSVKVAGKEINALPLEKGQQYKEFVIPGNTSVQVHFKVKTKVTKRKKPGMSVDKIPKPGG